jgi:hypothetical protein
VHRTSRLVATSSCLATRNPQLQYGTLANLATPYQLWNPSKTYQEYSCAHRTSRLPDYQHESRTLQVASPSPHLALCVPASQLAPRRYQNQKPSKNIPTCLAPSNSQLPARTSLSRRYPPLAPLCYQYPNHSRDFCSQLAPHDSRSHLVPHDLGSHLAPPPLPV